MRTNRAGLLVCLALLSPSLAQAQNSTWDTSHLEEVRGDIRSLPAADQRGIEARLHAKQNELRAVEADSPAGPMFLVQGVGDICGAANCEFWILDTNYRILLEKSTESYSILPQTHNGRPDILTSMHGSATDSSLSYWRFQGNRYVRIRCEDVNYSDADGNILSKPKITLHPCGTGG